MQQIYNKNLLCVRSWTEDGGFAFKLQLYGAVRELQTVSRHREHTGDGPNQGRERTSSLRGFLEVGRRAERLFSRGDTL